MPIRGGGVAAHQGRFQKVVMAVTETGKYFFVLNILELNEPFYSPLLEVLNCDPMSYNVRNRLTRRDGV
jgi:hypothetical protein